MTLLEDILDWSNSKLPEWQRDALRRLFRQQSLLSSEDYDELYTLLKANNKLPNPKNIQAVPLASSDLPAPIADGNTPSLTSMRKLKYVNKVLPGQTLPFNPTGITVIYGHNGSGKSGYTRVLKVACRARDQNEIVLPDAADPAAAKQNPQATFDIELNGSSKSVTWLNGEEPPPELSSIAVFDSLCARSYLHEGEVAFLPYGLDIVENLGTEVLPMLKQKLETEIGGIDVSRDSIPKFSVDSPVGKLIAELGPESNQAVIKSLAKLTVGEEREITELNRVLADSDPLTKSVQLKAKALRFKDLSSRIDAVSERVGGAEITRIKTVSQRATIALDAAKLAAATLRSGESLLDGTGDQLWKNMYEAAKQFSVYAAYPDHTFPHVSQDSVCLLCQQPVSGSKERLKRFNQFVKADTATNAERTGNAAAKELDSVINANLEIGLSQSLKSEIESEDTSLLSELSAFEKSASASRTWIVEALRTGTWENPPELVTTSRQKLRSVAAKELWSSRQFARAADESKVAGLEKRKNELQDRQLLSTQLHTVLSLVQRMNEKAKLESCRRELTTLQISAKSKEFANSAVSGTLRVALDNEFRLLGIDRIKTKLVNRTERGKTLSSLVLDIPANHGLENILSEGEQRALAIGSFLAELKLANHKGPIIFDDPVSSLDHIRRSKVAARLVEEGKQRQVIIFTHETVFLGELQDLANTESVDCLVNSLEWYGSNSGSVKRGLPWEQQGYKQRIDHLESRLRQISKTWTAYPSEDDRFELTNLYSLLRATIERVVQDVVLGGVVRRYTDWIRVGELAKVVGFPASEFSEIDRLYSRCNGIVDAHDPSAAKPPSPPDPTDFEKDITDLKELIKTTHVRIAAQKKMKP